LTIIASTSSSFAGDNAINRVTAKSTRKSAISKPIAQRMPGLRGTSTRRISNSAASRAACSGPAPPNATKV
jgi:hypothetical protein